jgi:hypothetical protein
MLIKTPVFSTFSVGLSASQDSVGPAQQNLTCPINISVANSTFIQKAYGTFTPANAYATAYTFSAGQIPTWILLYCDNPLNVYFSSTQLSQLEFSVSKVLLLAGILWSGNPVSLLLLGELSRNPVMAQGVPVNWCMYFGDGAIS